jgi:putative oxidoreductase
MLRIVAALILLQTLYFKFTGQPESVELFTKLGVEPWGRIGTGVIELIASILLLLPRTAFMGGGLAIGLMVGAIGSHITVLGIETKGDGGLLFIYAIVVLLCGAAICVIHRSQGMALLHKVLKRQSA